MEFLKDKNGVTYSQLPPTLYLTFDYYIYSVPQYRPKNILMLGYALGTTAGLIRLLYGDVPITGVDIDKCENRYNFLLRIQNRFRPACVLQYHKRMEFP